MTRETPKGSRLRYLPRLLLIIPVLAMLWVPSYNKLEPALAGIPFFYWFQLLLIPVSALTIYAADRLRKA